MGIFSKKNELQITGTVKLIRVTSDVSAVGKEQNGTIFKGGVEIARKMKLFSFVLEGFFFGGGIINGGNINQRKTWMCTVLPYIF